MKFARAGAGALARAARTLVPDDEQDTNGEDALELVAPVDEPEPAPSPSAEPPAPTEEPEGNALAQAATAERQRVATVFASDESKGRERAAADMLGTSMAAGEIVTLLGKLPKGDDDNAMLANLAGGKNPELGAGAAADDKPNGGLSVWDRVRARN